MPSRVSNDELAPPSVPPLSGSHSFSRLMAAAGTPSKRWSDTPSQAGTFGRSNGERTPDVVEALAQTSWPIWDHENGYAEGKGIGEDAKGSSEQEVVEDGYRLGPYAASLVRLFAPAVEVDGAKEPRQDTTSDTHKQQLHDFENDHGGDYYDTVSDSDTAGDSTVENASIPPTPGTSSSPNSTTATLLATPESVVPGDKLYLHNPPQPTSSLHRPAGLALNKHVTSSVDDEENDENDDEGNNHINTMSESSHSCDGAVIELEPGDDELWHAPSHFPLPPTSVPGINGNGHSSPPPVGELSTLPDNNDNDQQQPQQQQLASQGPRRLETTPPRSSSSHDHHVAAWDEDMPQPLSSRISMGPSRPPTPPEPTILATPRVMSSPEDSCVKRAMLGSSLLSLPLASQVERYWAGTSESSGSFITSAASSSSDGFAPKAQVSRGESRRNRLFPLPMRPAPPPPDVQDMYAPVDSTPQKHSLHPTKPASLGGHGGEEMEAEMRSRTLLSRSMVLPNLQAWSSSVAVSLAPSVPTSTSTTPGGRGPTPLRKRSLRYLFRDKPKAELDLFEDDPGHEPVRRTLLDPPEPESDETFRVWRPPSVRRIMAAQMCSLLNEDGKEVQFSELWPRASTNGGPEPRTIVIFIRNFWCGMCQEYMVTSLGKLSYDLLAARNVRIVVIGCGNWKIAAPYKDVFNLPNVDFYADPTARVYDLMGMVKPMPMPLPLLGRSRPLPEYNTQPFATQVWRGFKNGMVKLPLRNPGNIRRLGGEFILAPGNHIEFTHRMTHYANHMEAVDLVRRAGVDHPDIDDMPTQDELSTRDEFDRLTTEAREREIERTQELQRMRRHRAARRGTVVIDEGASAASSVVDFTRTPVYSGEAESLASVHEYERRDSLDSLPESIQSKERNAAGGPPVELVRMAGSRESRSLQSPGDGDLILRQGQF